METESLKQEFPDDDTDTSPSTSDTESVIEYKRALEAETSMLKSDLTLGNKDDNEEESCSESASFDTDEDLSSTTLVPSFDTDNLLPGLTEQLESYTKYPHCDGTGTYAEKRLCRYTIPLSASETWDFSWEDEMKDSKRNVKYIEGEVYRQFVGKCPHEMIHVSCECDEKKELSVCRLCPTVFCSTNCFKRSPNVQTGEEDDEEKETELSPQEANPELQREIPNEVNKPNPKTFAKRNEADHHHGVLKKQQYNKNTSSQSSRAKQLTPSQPPALGKTPPKGSLVPTKVLKKFAFDNAHVNVSNLSSNPLPKNSHPPQNERSNVTANVLRESQNYSQPGSGNVDGQNYTENFSRTPGDDGLLPTPTDKVPINVVLVGHQKSLERNQTSIIKDPITKIPRNPGPRDSPPSNSEEPQSFLNQGPLIERLPDPISSNSQQFRNGGDESRSFTDQGSHPSGSNPNSSFQNKRNPQTSEVERSSNSNSFGRGRILNAGNTGQDSSSNRMLDGNQEIHNHDQNDRKLFTYRKNGFEPGRGKNGRHQNQQLRKDNNYRGRGRNFRPGDNGTGGRREDYCQSQDDNYKSNAAYPHHSGANRRGRGNNLGTGYALSKDSTGSNRNVHSMSPGEVDVEEEFRRKLDLPFGMLMTVQYIRGNSFHDFSVRTLPNLDSFKILHGALQSYNEKMVPLRNSCKTGSLCVVKYRTNNLEDSPEEWYRGRIFDSTMQVGIYLIDLGVEIFVKPDAVYELPHENSCFDLGPLAIRVRSLNVNIKNCKNHDVYDHFNLLVRNHTVKIRITHKDTTKRFRFGCYLDVEHIDKWFDAGTLLKKLQVGDEATQEDIQREESLKLIIPYPFQ